MTTSILYKLIHDILKPMDACESVGFQVKLDGGET